MANVYPFRSLRYAPNKVPSRKLSRTVRQDLEGHARTVLCPASQQHYSNCSGENRPGGFSHEQRLYAGSSIFERVARKRDPGADTGTHSSPISSDSPCREPRRFAPARDFVGLGRLEDYANKVVFPHERTLTGPKKDRLELLRHTRTHFEQIFMLFEDPVRKIDGLLDEISVRVPDIQLDDEYGVQHTMWSVAEPQSATLIKEKWSTRN